MSSQTETVVLTTTTNVGGVVRQGANSLAFIAPYPTSGATIGANTPLEYTNVLEVETDYGEGSVQAVGAAQAFAEGLHKLFIVGVDTQDGSPFTQSFGTASAVTAFQLNTARLPISTVTSISVDGVDKTIVYTSLDPSALIPVAGEVYINSSTGEGKSGAATSGSGAGIVVIYGTHDWDTAFEALDENSYEYLAIPGSYYTAANLGMWDALVDHAVTARKVVAAHLASGVTVASITDTVTSIRNGRLKLLASDHTGDGTSAWAAYCALLPVSGTSKEQDAPSSLTYNSGYPRSVYGSEETPATGTWHYIGVNAVFKAPGGAFLISNDRACTALTDFERFHSTRRQIRVAENTFEEDLLAARRASPVALPFSDLGLMGVKNVLEGSLAKLTSSGIIVAGLASVPALSETLAADRLLRVLRGVTVSIMLTQQIHLFLINLEVGL